MFVDGWQDLAFHKKTIKDVDIKRGMSVLMRADFNVPLEKNGKISDDFRIIQTLPTIEYLLKKGAKLTIISHLGRPDGKVNPLFSLAPVADYLMNKLSYPVLFCDETIGEKALKMHQDADGGTLLILENLRFYASEENNDESFAQELAKFGELFVQDGFGASHRAHTSTEAITHFLPSVSGFLLQNEFEQITKAMKNPTKPLLAVIGGAKIADKIEVVNLLIEIADVVAIGGAMANTFLKAEGIEIGSSLYEKDEIHLAKEILGKAKNKSQETNFTFYLPQDGVVSKKAEPNNPTRIVDWTSETYADIEAYPSKPSPKSYTVQKDEMILDIGPVSASFMAGLARNAKTVIWNGNLGMTEIKSKIGTVGPYEHGSYTFLKAIEKGSAPKGQFSLIGGGDTASYVLGVKGIVLPDHVSTGGGASLELMAGKKLPAVEALLNL